MREVIVKDIVNINHTKRLVKVRGNGSGKLLDWFSAIVDNRALITSIQSKFEPFTTLYMRLKCSNSLFYLSLFSQVGRAHAFVWLPLIIELHSGAENVQIRLKSFLDALGNTCWRGLLNTSDKFVFQFMDELYSL